ncbi:MAG: TlpA family protein disulfide reductase [Acidobacteriaceae bacterium]
MRRFSRSFRSSALALAAAPLLAATLVVSLGLSGCDRGSRPSQIGRPAPDFTVADSTRTVHLAALRGHIVVLNFWATWCPPCVEETPSLVAMQRQMPGITVLAVSLDEDADLYHQFLKDNHVDLLTVRDPAQKSNALYGTFQFPETYVIDRNGIIRRKFIGAQDWTSPEILSYLRKLQAAS